MASGDAGRTPWFGLRVQGKEAKVFHARKWGWKRLAANLLLLPVLGGLSVGTAQAQFKSGGGAAMPVTRSSGTGSPGAAAPAAPSGDPKAMLKEGRKALAAGQFDRAQDMARAAEANNPTGKWGLFDDTPRSLMEDVQKAVGRQSQAQADQLVKEAKALASRKAASEAEKAANLDRAAAMAERAHQLHGPYSAWDFGDRADKLATEIKAARAKLKVPPAAPAAGGGAAVASNSTPGQYGSAFMPAGGNRPAFNPTGPAAGGGDYGSAFMPAGDGRANTPANDNRKATAVALMTEARKLADQNQWGAARAKLAEADRVGAQFAPSEYSPGFAIQELNARGSRAIDTLVAECGSQMARKDYDKAEAAVASAAEIAGSLGLFPRGVEEMRSQLKARSGGKAGGSTGVVAAGGTGGSTLFPDEPVKPAGTGLAKVEPIMPTDTGKPAMPTDAGKPAMPAGGVVDGRHLLAQAAIEFRNGALDMATTLASQAYNSGGPKEKEQATALLNSIDAEKHAQKQLTATRSFEAAQAAVKNRDYSHALGVLVLIDPKMLPEQSRGKHAELVAECRTALGKAGVPGMGEVATTGGMQTPGGSDAEPKPIPGVTPPGGARPADPRQGNLDGVAAQQDALRRVQVQKLRSEGLKVLDDAQKAFGRGETDLAVQMLLDHMNRVQSAGLEPSTVSMLLTQHASRLDMFRTMKGQMDSVTRLNKENREARDQIANRNLADDQRRAEVKSRIRKYHELVKAGDFKGAEKEAMVAKQLDPDDPSLGALAHMAKMQGRVREAEKIKSEREQFNLRALNDADTVGKYVTTEDPVAIDLDRLRRAGRRGSLDDVYLKTRSKAEFEIELKLDKPIPIEINQTPLEEALRHLREVTQLPISIDTEAIGAEGINLGKPVSESLPPVATRHVLTIILEKAGLSYVVENDVVKVTTTKKAKGRLFTKVFSVADLVTPIPNFAMPDYANMDKMLKSTPLSSGRLVMQGLNGPTPFAPATGLGGGTQTGMQSQLPGALAERPGIAGGLNVGAGGQLTSNPLAESHALAGERNTKHDQLIKLITGMVRPYSWDGMGGPGRIEYFDIGSALVVNQVADIIQEVADLLEALRRLQDLAIAVEIRIVSLSEAWYERIGVDFAMNIKTHNSRLEPALTQIDPNTGQTGVFAPVPWINDNAWNGATVGLTAAGVPTGDLGVPIRPNTFNRAIPAFGGYPNMPGDNGGIAFGLAFLNDIQVSLFMEAAQGDRRINVMQAPKLTLF
ncbi:MAG TPA: hypothetical protein VM597_08955, partial [Gemmataceae bacterium]|nr:hypothetical protein [Gemmataceae bacterium]